MHQAAIGRIELLYPFPGEERTRVLGRYREGAELVWAQEEPRNMGAWSYIAPRLQEMLLLPLRYEGRPECASPAEGYQHRHLREQKRIVTAALSGAPGPEAESGAEPRLVAKLIGKRK